MNDQNESRTFISYASEWDMHEGNVGWDELDFEDQNSFIRAICSDIFILGSSMIFLHAYETSDGNENIVMVIGLYLSTVLLPFLDNGFRKSGL